MPLFKVKVYDSKGDLKALRREAQNEDELLRTLGLEGYVPVSLEMEKARKKSSAIKLLALGDQHIFCTMLSAFLRSGLSLTEVLGLLQRQTRDKKLLKRINSLIKDIQRNTYEGIGKPEPLKGDLSGWWSRRIDDTHRIVYREQDGNIIIASCYGHYTDT